MATFAVIGANRGIGLELTRQLAARGDRVIAVCRTPAAELAVPGVEALTGVDITTDAGIARLAAEVPAASLDGLIVVAGVLRRVGLDALDLDELRREFEINALGPLRVVAALQGALRDGARVGLLTSRMGSIADNTSGSHYAYRMSKAALNMAGRSLAHDLAPRGITVALLHPGFVRTDMTGGHGLIDADEAARGLLARIDELDAARSGRFWHQDGTELPW